MAPTPVLQTETPDEIMRVAHKQIEASLAQELLERIRAAPSDFFGSLDRHKAAKGLFVTTSAFSPSARDTAEFLSKRIVLIDGEQLTMLMIRHNVGCRIQDILHIKKIDEDFFE